MSYLGKIIKGAVVLAAVGAILGLAAPMLASFAVTLGVPIATAATLSSTTPIWSAVFFGAFGAVNAAVTPIMDAIFSGHGSSRHNSNAGAVMTMTHVPVGHAAGSELEEVAPSTQFQDKFAASRPVEGSFAAKVDASRAAASEHSV